ncbi:MAG TPA: type II toxin-antitoxin system prevent-host-death family antitoxin [Pseudothermotoga sp.]|nr:type II toxin-antitoxin system prevent-host-death family antitoxin [Pseudothermotoga sp.]HOK82916.1 type II toxin-antitoxin system prevent-host-death family antitoxin [Pseudothermotoga sp.]HPP69910.1 type II toxin-antitoxin system prevent-host-death family antitoxin [Pseudothermotoga sp.]
MKKARNNDVLITRNGTPCAVVIDYERYKKMSKLLDDLYDLYLLEIGDPSKFRQINQQHLLEENIEEV